MPSSGSTGYRLVYRLVKSQDHCVAFTAQASNVVLRLSFLIDIFNFFTTHDANNALRAKSFKYFCYCCQLAQTLIIVLQSLFLKLISYTSAFTILLHIIWYDFVVR